MKNHVLIIILFCIKSLLVAQGGEPIYNGVKLETDGDWIMFHEPLSFPGNRITGEQLKNILISERTIGLVVLLVVIQFVRIDKTVPEYSSDEDIINIMQPSDEVVALLKSSCYDCHSNEVEYPWYSNVAPISWVVEHHIDEAREHLNFSTWGRYDTKQQLHKLEESFEEMEEGEMPLTGYAKIHGTLSEADRELLEDWFLEASKGN